MRKLTLYIILITSNGVFAQSNLYQLDSIYAASVSDYINLYYGKELLQYDKAIQGHPYYGNGNWTEGVIRYKGYTYHGEFLFDIVLSRLLVEDPFKGGMELLSEEIDYFVLEGSTFSWIDSKRIKLPLFSSGFYEILYEGEVSAFCKYSKIVKTENKDFRAIQKYEEVTRYLICIDGRFYKVNNKNSLRKVLKATDKSLAQFLQKSKLKFNENFKYSLKELLIEYEATKG